MKQLFLSFVAVGLLATASWAGSEVEAPMPITPEHEVACTARTFSPGGQPIVVTSDDCPTAIATMTAVWVILASQGL